MGILMRICHRIYISTFFELYKFFFKNKIGKVGEHLGINGSLSVINPRQLTIGDNCSLNHGVYINCFNPIEIGNDVTISANVTIVSTGIDYEKWFDTGKKEHVVGAKLTIADKVWI